jgi:hypothetical protein
MMPVVEDDSMKHSTWNEATAKVYSCGVDCSLFGAFSIQNLKNVLLSRTFLFSPRYLIVFSYVVDEHQYSGEFLTPRGMTEGSTFSVRYDPNNPEKYKALFF